MSGLKMVRIGSLYKIVNTGDGVLRFVRIFAPQLAGYRKV